eukprot:scaffold3583_cov110-Skeletonema_dohrnii-CCMP3373.AAC.2
MGRKINAVARALKPSSSSKATAAASRPQEASTSTENQVADDRNPEETVQEPNACENGSPREPLEEVTEGVSGVHKPKGILKNGNYIAPSNSLVWIDDDDDALTAMSSITNISSTTKGSYSTTYLQSKSIGGKWLDFIESRVIPSPFCRLACGDIDDESNSKYGPRKVEWRYFLQVINRISRKEDRWRARGNRGPSFFLGQVHRCGYKGRMMVGILIGDFSTPLAILLDDSSLPTFIMLCACPRSPSQPRPYPSHHHMCCRLPDFSILNQITSR